MKLLNVLQQKTQIYLLVLYTVAEYIYQKTLGLAGLDIDQVMVYGTYQPKKRQHMKINKATYKDRKEFKKRKNCRPHQPT